MTRTVLFLLDGGKDRTSKVPDTVAHCLLHALTLVTRHYHNVVRRYPGGSMKSMF